jgi:putative ABC transport system ATP-binding protein
MTGGVPVLSLRGVRKAFPSARGEVEVLRGVDLDIAPGSFVMVTGPSGSGKTTLLHLASLIDRPSRGQVLFRGEDVAAFDEERLSRLRGQSIGHVFQRFCLLPARSALENVMLRFRYTDSGVQAAETLSRRALDRVGLGSIMDRSARLLSAGEMQRVAIARAVALRPGLLAADEPTGNLDQDSADKIMECFTELNRDGITILMVTHNPDLLRYASRHLVCRHGLLEEAA